MSQFIDIFEVTYRTTANEFKFACIGVYTHKNEKLLDVLKTYDSSASYIVTSEQVN